MPQESGSVNKFREALVAVTFADNQTVECVIDTGFDGALMLPQFIVARLNLSTVGRLLFELVGGAQMRADVALGEIVWLGEPLSVEVIVSAEDDRLIGTEMLADCKLTVDYLAKSAVIQRDR
jgi:clan AA aspartic protease